MKTSPRHVISVLVLSALASGLASCSSTGDADKNRAPVGRSLYKVDTIFGDSVQGKTYALVRTPPFDERGYNAEFGMIERFLELEGMRSVEGTKMMPDFQVSYFTDRENPPRGISVGVTLPYTYTIRITGRRGTRLDWQVKVIGTSEEKERRASLPKLLGAARHFFGQSTGTQQRIYLQDDDPKILEIMGITPPPAPSPSPTENR